MMAVRIGKKYRAAIIGCGNIASLFDRDVKKGLAFSHAGAYRLHPRTELVAACDVDPKRVRDFAAKWDVQRMYTDYRDMLRRETIDVLSVCTPPQTHYPIVRDASGAQLKAIYCEKPVATKVVEAQKMVKLCRSRKILLMVNHQRRFGTFWQEVRAKIAAGALGGVQQVTCYYTRGIYNTGVHILDLFAFLFGPAVKTAAVFSSSPSPFSNDPNIDGLLFMKSGAVISLQACDDSQYLILEIDILGTKGRLRIGRQVEYFEAVASQNLLGKKELVGGPSPIETDYGAISLVDGVEHIIRCLEKKDKPLSSGAQAMESLKMITAMIASAKTGKPVRIGDHR